jgi:signal transduction histidine kinase
MRYCGYCGVRLAYAAVQAEWKVKLQEIRLLTEQLSPRPLPNGIPITPEILVPRLGDTLLEKEVLQREELERALAYQQEQAAGGRDMLLGQALLELGLVDPGTLDQVITFQILQLQNALQQTNQQLELRVQERTRELQQAVDKLTDLSQLKSNFIANISHELRTPLTHIKGYLEILAEQGLGPLSSQQQEAIAVLRRAEGRLERLIEDLIQFSLAARGELSLELDEVDLRDLFQKALEGSLGKARENGVTVRISLPDQLARARCDKEKIRWIVAQLLDNAIKFTPRGGRVTLEAREKDGWLWVAIVDSGIGIPAHRLDEIFEPFHQLDGSSTRRYAGTGLGLALSSRILEAHGSRLTVQSVEGKGSRFAFFLPFVAQKPFVDPMIEPVRR